VTHARLVIHILNVTHMYSIGHTNEVVSCACNITWPY
jgi:hypothetical protein